jgi:hypothetical protein
MTSTIFLGVNGITEAYAAAKSQEMS